MTASFDPVPAARFLADVWHGSKQVAEPSYLGRNLAFKFEMPASS